MRRMILSALFCAAALSVAARAQQQVSAGLRLISVKDRAQAGDLRVRIQAGERFDDLAEKYSIDSSAAGGGYLGLFVLDDLSKQVRDALAGLQPGEMSPVIKVGDEYVLLQLLTQQELASALSKASQTRSTEDRDRPLPVKSPLHVAAQKGDMEAVQRLITSNSASVNTKDTGGATPLHLAAMAGKKEIVETLLEHGAALNERDGEGFTALNSATEHGYTDIVLVLLSHGADPNIPSNDGREPLHFAARQGHLELINLLLDSRSRVDAEEEHGETPLARAALYGHKAAVELLIKRGAGINNVNEVGNTPLHAVASCGNLVADAYNTAGFTPGRDYLELVQFFSNSGLDINRKNIAGETPLSVAIQSACREIAKTLVTTGADVNTKNNVGKTPLIQAVFMGQTDVVDLLLSHNADLRASDINGNTALHEAAFGKQFAMDNLRPPFRDQTGTEQEYRAVVQMLLAKNADVNAKNRFGNTPLHLLAKYWDDKTAAESLVAHSANLEMRTNLESSGLGPGKTVERVGSQTPLHLAVENGHSAVAEVLLNHNAAVNVKDEVGATPLHWAVLHGQAGLVELLLKQNADMNARDISGATPLLLAAFDAATKQDADAAILQLLIRSDVHATAELVPEDPELLPVVRNLAEQGYAFAQFGLGSAYYRGVAGLRPDLDEARRWYRKAAAQGHAGAENELGAMYQHGEAGSVNLQAAEIWYRKAAQQQFAAAENNLGFVLTSLGGEQRYLEAVVWFRKAVDHGNVNAIVNLGRMYEQGTGVLQDYGIALDLCRKGAERGESYAFACLGDLYVNGTGVAHDDVEAYAWYSLASANVKSAKATMEALTTRLTMKDISDASQRAKKWLSEHPQN